MASRRGGGGGGTGATSKMIVEDPTTAAAEMDAADSDTEHFLKLEDGVGDDRRIRGVAVSGDHVAGDIDPPPSSGGSAYSAASSGGSIMQPLSLDRRYAAERRTAKVRHWKEGPHAAGLVELTWSDELSKRQSEENGEEDGSQEDANGPLKRCCEDFCQEDMEPTCCCLQMSGVVCAKLGAGRIGNMAILKESSVLVEEEVPDTSGEEEGSEDEVDILAVGGKKRTRTVRKTRLDCVVGPYWPMLFCVTYPLVLGISLWTAVAAIPSKPLIFQLVWAGLTGGLVFALFSVSCRDPGILPRHREPPQGRGGEWRWNDQAQTYRPRGAVYDSDCAVVIEEFDHTCPWTGTGIGKKNMPAFQAFVCLVFVCLIVDILTLTGAFG